MIRLYNRMLSILHRKFDERPIYAHYFTQEVWWEAYIHSVFYTGSLMKGLYTLSILLRKSDERPIYAQYFTQEV
jgi:hypothetical protein